MVVVFGDQLDATALNHLGATKDDDTILLMEVAGESEHVASHVQRTVLFLSAMRHYALDRKKDGWRVEYVSLDDSQNSHAFADELQRAFERLRPDEVTAIMPGEWRVRRTLEDACADAGLPLTLRDDPHFLCSIDEFAAWRKNRKSLLHEHFYRRERKRLHVLMTEDGKPEGGTWNFDKENRKSFRVAPNAPEAPVFEPDAITQDVIDMVQERLPDLPGRIDSFRWPVTREQALEVLGSFLSDRLPNFGDYQDAMWEGRPFLYHSLISTAINLKLLNPREVYERAIEAYEKDQAPLNCVEGFVRQIIGWREFIRGVYWTESEEYAERNGLEQHCDLPSFYWDGETDMACMRDSLSSVLDHAYAHHISRLMITGNFALIAGVHPRAVSDWYLGMYADAIDWVTLPNTLGMAMHADGGVVGTKPYAASGKYIKRMGNFCKTCRYDVESRTGEDACPFNVFYWDFLLRNEERLSKNQRMNLILANLKKIDKDERVQITVSAQNRRNALGIGGVDAN